MRLRLTLCVLLAAVWAPAHHSPVVFDLAQEVTLDGTVTGFRWTNPHAWIQLTVPDRSPGQDGDGEVWDVELTSPQHLVRAGWRATSVQAGDEVRIVVNPLRSGESIGKFVSVRLPDGQVLTER
jgi:hypothetical protein